MKTGDKVRFLNDVGGGKITAFRPGGIVLVEDADGFEVPVHQDEVVVIEEEKTLSPSLPRNGEGDHTVKKSVGNKPDGSPHYGGDVRKDREGLTLNGKEYLKSKTVAPVDEESDAEPEAVMDEQLEARIVRLEMTIQKLEARIALLEAENNLRKNEQQLARQAKPKSKPQSDKPTTLGDLKIL